jgi:RimJ/RimL family protein N-acetyltransferase
MITIRQATLADIALLASFILQLDRDCDYLLHDPDERTEDFEVTKKFLFRVINNARSAIFIAEHAVEGVVAYVCGEALIQKRVAHVMKVNIGALKKYQKKGMGRVLAYKLHEHALRVGIYRAEASIIKENNLSLNLAKRMGFELESIKRHAFKIKHQYVDECMLVKFL